MEGYKNLEEKLLQMAQSLNENLKGSKGPNLVKGEFPKFYGFNSRKWIKDCSKFFSLFGVHEDEKVKLASHYMFDKARIWVDDYLFWRKSVYLDWTDFMLAVVERFKDEVSLDVLEQFKKLQQHGSVESYIDEFCALRSVMLRRTQLVPDTDILDHFLGGLQPDVKSFVEAFKPTSITKAIDYARLHFASSNSSTPKTCSIQFFSSKSIQPAPLPQFAPLPPKTKPPLLPTPTNNLNNQSILLLANSKPPLLPTPTNIKPQTSIHPLQFVPLTSNTKPPTYHTQLDTRKPHYILGCEEEKCVEISVERQCAKCSEVAKESEIGYKCGTGPIEISEVVIEDKGLCFEKEEIFEVGIEHEVMIREMLEEDFQSVESNNQEVFGKSNGEWSAYFDYKELHSWGNHYMLPGLAGFEPNNLASCTKYSPLNSSSGQLGALPSADSWGARASKCNPPVPVLTTTASNGIQSSISPSDIGKKQLSNEETYAKQTKSKSEISDIEKQQASDKSQKNVSEVSSTPSVAPVGKSTSPSSCSLTSSSDVKGGEQHNNTYSIDGQSCSPSESKESISAVDEKIHKLSSEMSSISFVKQLNSELIEVSRLHGLSLSNFVSPRNQHFPRHDSERLPEQSSSSITSKDTTAADFLTPSTHIRPPSKPPPKPPPLLVFGANMVLGVGVLTPAISHCNEEGGSSNVQGGSANAQAGSVKARFSSVDTHFGSVDANDAVFATLSTVKEVSCFLSKSVTASKSGAMGGAAYSTLTGGPVAVLAAAVIAYSITSNLRASLILWGEVCYRCYS